MTDQQILNPELCEWFEGLMKGGLTATKAVSVYEEFVFGGNKAGDVELLSQVLCVFIFQRSIGTYLNSPTCYCTVPDNWHAGDVVSSSAHSEFDSAYF